MSSFQGGCRGPQSQTDDAQLPPFIPLWKLPLRHLLHSVHGLYHGAPRPTSLCSSCGLAFKESCQGYIQTVPKTPELHSAPTSSNSKPSPPPKLNPGNLSRMGNSCYDPCPNQGVPDCVEEMQIHRGKDITTSWTQEIHFDKVPLTVCYPHHNIDNLTVTFSNVIPWRIFAWHWKDRQVSSCVPISVMQEVF